MKKLHPILALALVLFLSLALVAPALAFLTTGWLDTGFDPGTGANDIVRAVAVQPDGKILIGGRFDNFDGTARKGLALLKADGSLDTGYVPALVADSNVAAIAVQSDLKAIVAGTRPPGSTPFLTRLNDFGGVDLTFDPGTGPNFSVEAMAIQPDGKIIIGGGFTTYNGIAVNRIARLNLDGSLDTSFDPGDGPNSGVQAVVVQPDGKIIIGGTFSKVDGTNRNCIARLDAGGGLDTGFTGTLPERVRSLALQGDGMVIVGGHFSDGVRRLKSTGVKDTTFSVSPAPNGDVHSVVVQSDGRVIAGGNFTTVGGYTKYHMARFSTDGSVEVDYLKSPAYGVGPVAADVLALALQEDGKVVLGGSFSNVNGKTHNNISRLHADSMSDDGLDPGSGAGGSGIVTVYKVAAAPDGKLLIGGTFTSFDGLTRLRVARLMSDGQVDGSYGSVSNGPNDNVLDLVVQQDGKAIIGGEFTQVGGTDRKYIARLNTNGSLDTTFAPGDGLNGWAKAVALQPNGKVIVGGDFTEAGGTIQQGIARFKSDGSLDTSFDPGTGTNGSVNALALQSDGKVIITGNFTKVNGVDRRYIARLRADGSLDSSFDPGTGPDSAVIYAIAIQSDGKIIIGGGFASYNGTYIKRIARLNPDGTLDSSFDPGDGPKGVILDILVQNDANLLIGGTFTQYDGTSRGRIARIKANGWAGSPDGTLDTGFDSLVGADGTVRTVAMQPGAKVVIGGDFDNYRTKPKPNVTRVNGGRTPATYNVDADDGQVGEPYSYHFLAKGLPVPTWAASPGTLPPGLVLDEITGVMSGTPTTAGTYVYGIWACNYLTGCGSATSSMDIAEPAEAVLTVKVEGEGTGAVTSQPAGIDCDDQGGDCTETYLAYQDTQVTLNASPDTDFRLINWSGACSGSAVTCQLTMNADKSVTATFGPDVAKVILPIVLRDWP